MTANITMYSTHGGIIIPVDAQIMTYGQFTAVKNGKEGDEEYAKVFDNLIRTLDLSAIKRLAQELTQFINPIKGVSDFHEDKGEPIKMNEVHATKARRSPNYREYVFECATRSVSMMAVASKLAANKGMKHVSFVFKNGTYYMAIDGVEIHEDQIPDYLVEEYNRIFGKKIQLKNEGILEKIASKAFSSDKKGEDQFNNSGDKIINDVSLREMAHINSVGLFLGSYKIEKVPVQMTGGIASYLTSDTQGLRAFYTDSNGVMKSGHEVQGSHQFYKNGFDKYRLGLRKGLSQAIARDLGVTLDIDDARAKEKFLHVARIFKEHYITQKQTGVPNQGLDRYLLYNPSWLAEEYSKACVDPRLLADFAEKYTLLVRGAFKFLGHSTYCFLIDTTADISKGQLSRVFKLMKMVPKLVGHYSLIRTFDINLTLLQFITRFFFKNFHPDMKLFVMDMLELMFREYNVGLPLMGVSKGDMNPFEDFDLTYDAEEAMKMMGGAYDDVQLIPYEEFKDVRINKPTFYKMSGDIKKMSGNAGGVQGAMTNVSGNGSNDIVITKTDKESVTNQELKKPLVPVVSPYDMLLRSFPEIEDIDCPGWTGTVAGLRSMTAWMLSLYEKDAIVAGNGSFVAILAKYQTKMGFDTDPTAEFAKLLEICGFRLTSELESHFQNEVRRALKW